MHDPTRFGDFLLFKKLSEDPLGETYRAGRINGTSVGSLVFLRTFKLTETRAIELAQEQRAATPRIQAPGLAYAAESGVVSGVAYVAYTYSIGWDIPQFITTATSGFSDLEQDHGLLIAERLALALATVHQTAPSVARPSHGFLIPQSVHLSSEGDIELRGIESGAYLASLAARGEMKELLPYLSPEVRGGQIPTPSDDVYSLGALLWQLLTSQVPPLDVTGITTALASARLASGEMLPTGLAEILQSSLAAPRGRLANATLWHNKLTEWMGSNEVRTTHFDLAFFIHELFRKQIQVEQDESEQEKKFDLSPRPPAPVAIPETPEMSDVILRPDLSGMVQRPSQGAIAPEARAPEPSVAETAGKSKLPWLGGLAALLLLGAFGVWFALQRGGATPAPPPQAPPPPPPPPVMTEEAPSEGLQVAQLELERLVREQGAAMNDQLAEEYEANIRSLREQLEAAEAAEAAEREAVAQTALAASESSTGETAAAPQATSTQEAPSGSDSNSSPTPPPPAREATPPPAQSVPPPAQSAPPPAQATSPPAQAPPPPAQATPPPSATAQPAPAMVSAEPATTESATVPPARASPPPPPPQVTNVTPPRRLKMPEPRYPTRAQQQRKEATVLIKVLVSAQGKVRDAKPVLDKGDPHGFYEEAMRAARQAEFAPARSNGTPIEMWTTVVIAFQLKK